MVKYLYAIWSLCILIGGVQACKQPIKENTEQTISVVSNPIQPKRYGWVIKIKAEKLDEYKALHADPWPGVMEQIRKSNIRNYSIYLKDDYLFGYFEYVGDNFDADMAKMAEDSLTQEWWKRTDPCQEPLANRAQGEWWAQMEEIFHLD